MEKKKILLIIIIALVLEVIVFNITSYYTLLGRNNIREYENPKMIRYDDNYAVLEIDNINCKTYSVKLNLSPIDELAVVRI